MTNVGVVGSRTFKDYAFLCDQLDMFWLFLGAFTVVSGGATGADTMAVRWANAHKLPIPIVFPADFYKLGHPEAVIKMDRRNRPYDAAAGFRRNQEIIDASDMLIAFWNEKSPGTKDSIERAKQAGKPVYVLWPVQERVYGTR